MTNRCGGVRLFACVYWTVDACRKWLLVDKLAVYELISMEMRISISALVSYMQEIQERPRYEGLKENTTRVYSKEYNIRASIT